MLILVAVTVRTAVNSGLFGHAQNAVKQWKIEENRELGLGNEVDEYLNKYGNDSGTEEHIHEWGNWEIINEATCGEKGEEIRECLCGKTETREIEPTGMHNWDQGIVTVVPTYSSTGIRTYTCMGCNQKRTESIPMLTLPGT